jgi:asparaginyl-tRNA synthetase
MQEAQEKIEKLAVADPTVDIYVCEVSGDDANKGLAKTDPLKTAIQAFHLNSNPRIFVRKALEGADAEWKEISGAGLKKAKKGWELAKKKADKEGERMKKEAEDKDKKAEEERKRLEESKAVKITRDSSLPAAEKVPHHFPTIISTWPEYNRLIIWGNEGVYKNFARVC